MAYGYYRSLTIDHTKVGASDATSFPVLVSGTYAYLATVANSGKVQNASGYDIAFFSDSALTTQLKHETERWVAATGEVIYWVKVPTVSHTVDTVIYIAYGNAAISSDQSDKVNVWDANFAAVYHLPDGASLTANDSTTNANNGTNTGSSAVTGEIGGGASLNGSTNFISAADSTSLNFGTGNFTASLWIKTTASSRQALINKDLYNSGSGNGWYLDLLSGGNVRCDIDNVPGSNNVNRDSTATINNGAWHHVVMVRTGATAISVYIDGSLSNGTYSNTGTTGTVTNTEPFQIGKAANGYGPLGIGWFNGSIDEVRLSNTNRSADWITAEYNSQSSPSTFYTVGAESSTGGGGGGATVTDAYTSSSTWTCPAGVVAADIEVLGAGGGGGFSPGGVGGAGGGGGAYSKKISLSVTPGSGYTVNVGTGGAGSGTYSVAATAGGDSYFVNTGTVLAKGGGGGQSSSGVGAAGGASASGVGDTKYSGGTGGYTGTGSAAGGGGGAGSTGDGGSSSGTTAGTGTAVGGGSGGTTNGQNGSTIGGGGAIGTSTGGSGARGEVRITYTLPATATRRLALLGVG